MNTRAIEIFYRTTDKLLAGRLSAELSIRFPGLFTVGPDREWTVFRASEHAHPDQLCQFAKVFQAGWVQRGASDREEMKRAELAAIDRILEDAQTRLHLTDRVEAMASAMGADDVGDMMDGERWDGQS